jgi:hypothetical protein
MDGVNNNRSCGVDDTHFVAPGRKFPLDFDWGNIDAATYIFQVKCSVLDPFFYFS